MVWWMRADEQETVGGRSMGGAGCAEGEGAGPPRAGTWFLALSHVQQQGILVPPLPTSSKAWLAHGVP